jgi:hypothetical protein
VSWLATGDFNGDGIPDLAVIRDLEDTAEFLLGHGDGTFGIGRQFLTALSTNGVVGRFDNLALPEVVFAGIGSSVLLQNTTQADRTAAK